MWFNRKQKNRRFNRGHVLDVKLRSDQVRATRMRLAAVVLGVSFGTIFGLYLVWRVGEWTLDRLVYENSSFAIQEFKVRTDGVISTEQLRRWSGAKVGDNLFALDLAKVKRKLEFEPLIQSVSIERVLPRTLSISVHEREPIAQVNVSGLRPGGGVQINVFHVDADGFVMLPLDPRDHAVPLNQQKDLLPVIAGIEPSQLQPGRRIDLPQLQSALQLIVAFEHSPMVGIVDLRRIDVTSAQVLLVTTDQGSQITFGLQDFDRQLRFWRKTRDEALRTNRGVIASLNLAISNNGFVRFMEAGAVPPRLPGSVEPTRNRTNRRRNV